MDNYAQLKAGKEEEISEILSMATESVATTEELFAVKDGIGVFCQVRPNGKCIPVGLFKLLTMDDIKDYKKGFFTLLEYFDSISDEEQPKVVARLKELGL